MSWLPICASMPTTRMPGSAAAVGVDVAGAREGNAELVLLAAGRDLLVRPRVDVGIDAEADARLDAARAGDLREERKLRLRFHVEAVDAGVEPEGRARAPSCRRRRRRSCRPGCRRRARGEARPPRRRRRRRRAARAWRSPPGWSSPSANSRSDGRGRRRPRRRRGSGASASPSNSNRTACRPRAAIAGTGNVLGVEHAVAYARNDARPSPLEQEVEEEVPVSAALPAGSPPRRRCRSSPDRAARRPRRAGAVGGAGGARLLERRSRCATPAAAAKARRAATRQDDERADRHDISVGATIADAAAHASPILCAAAGPVRAASAARRFVQARAALRTFFGAVPPSLVRLATEASTESTS